MKPMTCYLIQKRTSGAACALLMLLLSQTTLAQEDEDTARVYDFLEEEHALSVELETPHTKWAKPYARGPVRAVFFCPWFQGSTDAREIVELMQRFDLDASAAYWNGSRLVGDGNPGWYGGDPEAGTKRALALLAGKPHVIVVNRISFDALPDPIRDNILDRVREGTGLILVEPEGSSHPWDAESTELAPHRLQQGRFHQLGRGRVARLTPPEKPVYGSGWEAVVDHRFAEFGRVLLWAAKREPDMDLSIDFNRDVIERDALPAACATICWSGAPSGTRLYPRLRHVNGTVEPLEPIAADGNNYASVTLPKRASGDYTLEVMARSERGIENWCTAPVRIAAPAQIAMSLSKDWAEPGETMNVAISVNGHSADRRVQLQLLDVNHRILRRESSPADHHAISFNVAIDAWLPMLVRVEASLMDADGAVTTADKLLRITNRKRDQFHFVMWNYAGGDLAPYAAEALSQYGVTSILQQGPPPPFLSASDLAYVPYAASFRASSHTLTAMLDPATGFLKSGCVHDPVAMGKSVSEVVAGAMEARRHGTFVYSLGDENAVRASCLSSHCLRAYRDYLRVQYGHIAALNAEWETNYASFDEIELLANGPLPAPDAPAWFKEYYAERRWLHSTDNEGATGGALDAQIAMGDINDEMRALQTGNFARWYDRQAFQCATYVAWCKQFQRAFREIDPHAWTGFEGTDSFTLRRQTTRSRQGGDLDAFVRELDYFGPYEGPANEVVRSIAPRTFPMGNWIGYDPRAGVLLEKYWSQVCDGMNTIQWWRWDNLDGYHGYLTPALAPFPAVRELLDDTQVVRDGLGSLLMRYDMHDDAIAMLYSMPSTHIAHFDGNETYGEYKRDHDRWHKLIHGAGLQFRYVTDRMLRLGEFDAKRYKVLILPMALAISETEAAVIRDFVRDGGTVIADIRPALYDGHCKPLRTGQLDDVFGIDRTEKRAALEVDRVSVAGDLNGKPVQMRWGNWHGKDIYPRMKIDPAVTLTNGKALGLAFHLHYWAGLQTPVCVVNEYAKGKAVLLNFSIFDAPAAGFIPELLDAAGVSPAIRLSEPDGAAVRDVEVTRWHNGGYELLMLLSSRDGDVSVTLPAPCNVFDMKSSTAIGSLSQFNARLRPHRASVFALLPNAMTPHLRIATTPATPGEVAKVRISIPNAAGAHAIKLRATRPDGSPAPWFNQTVIAEKSRISVELPLAHNDPAGTWAIEAIDLLSGANARCPLTVH